ncbi:MAG: glutathione peroxidase [Luminiphilus sp.]|nr:glutathione peroxidase [Luminiphilus sp.]
MKKHLLIMTMAALTNSPALHAGCPDFLDHSMRRLASTDSIQFCEAYEGKALLIVNTASYCGYTPQFESLEQIHRDYRENGLVVVGFSSDDFFQEDNDEGDAAEICFEKYEVSFPVMATSAVRGDDANPVFKGLGAAAGYPSWNFNKYLISSDGQVIGRFSSSVKPDSEELRTAIRSALPSEQI